MTPLMPAASVHSSTARFAHAGTGTVRICFPLPAALSSQVGKKPGLSGGRRAVEVSCIFVVAAAFVFCGLRIGAQRTCHGRMGWAALFIIIIGQFCGDD